MKHSISHWKKNWNLMNTLFSEAEVKSVRGAIKKLKVQHVAYCSFENRFAKSGGLAAVTTKLLPYLKESAHIPNVMLITPFYSNISDISKLKETGITFTVPFGNDKIQVSLLSHTWKYTKPANGSVHEYYLKADGFFDSQNKINDPYLYIENDVKANDDALRLNSLFYCQAVPRALAALGITENIIMHLQDWQTALLSLTAKQAMLDGVLQSCGTIQTMHNAFDSSIPWETLASILSPAQLEQLQDIFYESPTAFQLGLQLVDGPLSTVSDNFANEFTTDIMQSQHFAPHLQDIFHTNGVYGLNNGMFVDFAPEFSDRSRLPIHELKAIKLNMRKGLLEILDHYHPPQRFGELSWQGGSIKTLPDEIPLLVMSGRLDPVQKGFDILLRAIQQFAKDEIKVILTPMPVKESDLDFFRETADRCAGNVTVYPIRLQEGFRELQMGSTFGIMPSIYEPFGAAVEFAVNGTLNIARATGGLVDQIDDGKNGFLFRESDNAYSLTTIKQYANSADSVEKRNSNAWVKSMVTALADKIKQAIVIYQQHPDTYYKMINKGLSKARQFDWDTSAKKYVRLFRQVNKGFY